MGAYIRPNSLQEALRSLAVQPLTVLAGGTDFYPARVERAITEDILDISALAELRGIRDEGDHWRIGAGTTWTDLLRTDLHACFDGLKLAAREVGGVQIQNAGTIVGNICNASPAADSVPNLLCLDAAVEIASAVGTRWRPIADFITGNRRTQLHSGEMVTALLVHKPAGPCRSTFLKLGARKYLVISIVMVAALAEIDGSRIARARVSVGACSEVARRLPELEKKLQGQPVDADLSNLVSEEDLAPLAPIDDVRGSAGYRNDAALTLVRRAVTQLARPT